MDRVVGGLTVFFESPFWVGVFERVDGGRLSACKITFGVEPKGHEVLDVVLRHYWDLEFSPAVETKLKKAADNPKRRQRAAEKLLQNRGVGTKAQQALSAQREERQTERRHRSRTKSEEEKHRQFELKQQKRKAKHRGH